VLTILLSVVLRPRYGERGTVADSGSFLLLKGSGSVLRAGGEEADMAVVVVVVVVVDEGKMVVLWLWWRCL
jgi:hypothetical protein